MKKFFKVGVLTTGRADFSIYSSVIKAMQKHPALSVGVFMTGMHLSKEFGMTSNNVRASGFPVLAEFSCLDPRDTPIGISSSMGQATIGMAEALEANPVDMLMVLGDRFEMCAAALGVVPFRIPLAHLHGGDETEGAIDNVFRHTLTKISQLHFCATSLAGRRIIQMGENPENVHIVGAPAIDNMLSVKRLSRTELSKQFGLPDSEPYILLTYHPVTINPEATKREFEAICAALDALDMYAVFTAANADAAGRDLNSKIYNYSKKNQKVLVVENMGTQGFYSAMDHGSFFLGNSSSGILEAASFATPTINVGERQAGRERSPNTLDVNGDFQSIMDGIKTVMTPEFQSLCDKRKNVYGSGIAGPQIANAIDSFLTAGNCTRKSFNMLNGVQ
ncbi:UDP-N-acetylglucosamine 2-epimerase [Hellea sp.]|nr:UDP-N-acetylglucosamine 2-epimerase [Hellea sp.]MDB4843925.1 UDP-N-acetylglucosamine 2-epimerase [Hellea sp.]MDC1061709.1 UDP-N-acetylglucosamine 2-epimerase [Hellea sp.]